MVDEGEKLSNMKNKEKINHIELIQKAINLGRYIGNDNYGKPKISYLLKLTEMSDADLRKACESDIWLSAYANNNPRSDYHWMCDACYDECSRRGKPEIYSQSHKYVSSNC